MLQAWKDRLKKMSNEEMLEQILDEIHKEQDHRAEMIDNAREQKLANILTYNLGALDGLRVAERIIIMHFGFMK